MFIMLILTLINFILIKRTDCVYLNSTTFWTPLHLSVLQVFGGFTVVGRSLCDHCVVCAFMRELLLFLACRSFILESFIGMSNEKHSSGHGNEQIHSLLCI